MADPRIEKSMAAARGLALSVPRPVQPAATRANTIAPRKIEDEFPNATEVAFRYAFVGAGQGGGRIANAFHTIGYRRVAVFNTTEADFNGIDEAIARYQCNIGGAAKDIELGRQALARSTEEVYEMLTRAWGADIDYGFVCASLGGGTGSGAVTGLVELVRKYMTDRGVANPKVGAIISLPAVSDGFQVCRNAVATYQKLAALKVSPLIVVDNTRIDELYSPSMAQLHNLANSVVAQLFHVFNILGAAHSPYITFDKAELGQVLDSGVVVMGSADIPNLTSPADVSAAVREQLTNSVLTRVDLSRGTVGTCVLVGHHDVLTKCTREFFDAGYNAMERVVGSSLPEGTQRVVHRGLYEGQTPGLQANVMVGGLEVPREKLLELAKKGEMLAPSSSTAQFLGLA